ncbi:cysteate racemase [Marinimicrococcus flavescens]|uniref:Amino acid racemase n=1 Tax=Marinimicrococcus flavescens TaxID=3031815 RepID=A0AAP3XRB3_9PROT|nr:amino acid racemase [Marinimicrococcus flavescens]
MKEAQDDLTVGVLGGLGPEATLDFMGKVLRLSGARSDQEHLHLLIDCNPKVSNRNDAIASRGPSSGPALVAMAQRLEAAGADFLVMACNTAHFYEAGIRAGVRVPFVSIVEETCTALARRLPGARRFGVLAAGGCRQAGLYEKALRRHGFEPVVTDEPEQARFMELMYAIKAGERGGAVAEGMRALGEALIARGAEAVIAACTEVPLVLGEGDLSRPLVDSTAILAEATVAYGKRRRPLPVQGDHAPSAG